MRMNVTRTHAHAFVVEHASGKLYNQIIMHNTINGGGRIMRTRFVHARDACRQNLGNLGQREREANKKKHII